MANMKPPLKWAGGKRWLVNRFQQTLDLPFKRYVEPFLGSGAVFFHLQPDAAILSDTNRRLINFYTCLRDYPDRLMKLMRRHSRLHSEDYYYTVRERTFADDVESAAQFLYLNRTCWNGLYRENLKGIFNVPKGTKDSVLFEHDDFRAFARTLKRTKLLVSDFEPILRKTRAGDFVFIDPPYTVKHNVNGFIKYNENIFSWDDQIRLADTLRQMRASGANYLLTNADHPSVETLYLDFARVHRVSRSSVLSGSTRHRGKTTEALIFIGPDWSKLPNSDVATFGSRLNSQLTSTK